MKTVVLSHTDVCLCGEPPQLTQRLIGGKSEFMVKCAHKIKDGVVHSFPTGWYPSDQDAIRVWQALRGAKE